MHDTALKRLELKADLQRALEHEEFQLYYQPVIELASGHISGVEALIRWIHPVRGMVPPLDFIPLAEETGLIVPIGEWVLKTACAEAVRWSQPAKVAINLSAIQLKSSNVLQMVVATLASTRLAPTRLELEVTESVLLDESDAVIGTLRRLHDMGVRIALDDFGTGYSSLGYLKRFSFDKIKIDRSFVSELTKKENNSLAIVRTVAALGKSLGISTCAEGVETAEELEHVRKEGYTEVQGYLVSRPIPAGDIPALFARYTSKPIKRA
jgi:EAL domain-containing protein (putative c-di-GMP-specific phosphodiesterase class I)